MVSTIREKESEMQVNGVSNAVSLLFDAARVYVQHRAHQRAEDALTEIKAGGQFARRSIGQRVRFINAKHERRTKWTK